MTLVSYLRPCSGHQPEGPIIRHHESYDVRAVQATCCVLKTPKMTDGEKQSRHLGRNCSHSGEQQGNEPTLGVVISPNDSRQEL